MLRNYELILRLHWWRFQKWADRQWCNVGVILHLRNPEACRGCGRTDLTGWDPTGADTWCENCCPDHDYKSDGYRSGAFCIRCDQPAPYDWFDRD